MEERKLYRIKRGSYTRRDGPETRIIDCNGHATGTLKAHVTYCAKTMANRDAKDEVYMTDEEADKFGRHRLDRLLGQDIKIIQPKQAPADGIKKTKVADLKDGDMDTSEAAAMIAALIKKGEKAKTPKEKRDFAKEVGNADLIDEVPDKHSDIIDALKELA